MMIEMHRREDRSIDEEGGDVHRRASDGASVVASAVAAVPRIVVSFGVTCMPGRTRCSPLDDDDVLRARVPCDDTQPVDDAGPSCDGSILELVVGAEHQHEASGSDRCRWRDPRSELASRSTLPSNCTRANRPGVKRPSLFSSTARARIVPVRTFELVVDEIHVAVVRKARLVGQADAHGIACTRASSDALVRCAPSPGTADRRSRRLRSRRRSDRRRRSW